MVKRSSDETPFRIKVAARGVEVSVNLFNQRCFLRWSATHATRCIFPAVELMDASGSGLLEALERVSPALSLESAREICARLDFCPGAAVGQLLCKCTHVRNWGIGLA